MQGKRRGHRSAVGSGVLTGLSTAAVSASAALAGLILARKFGHGVKTDGFFAAYSVYLALAVQGLASSLIGPGIAAMSLALVGRAALSERIGRNARFAAIGNGLAAGVMGIAGAYLPAEVLCFRSPQCWPCARCCLCS